MLSASVYSIVAKRFDDGTDALSLTTWQFSTAAVLMVTVIAVRSIADARGIPIGVPPRYWLTAAAVGLGGFALSYFLHNWVVSRVDVGWAAIILNLIPVFGLLGAILFLNETLTTSAEIGALLIGASIVYFSIYDIRGTAGSVT